MAQRATRRVGARIALAVLWTALILGDGYVIQRNVGIELHGHTVVAPFVLHLETVESLVERVEVRADGNWRVSGCIRCLNDDGIIQARHRAVGEDDVDSILATRKYGRSGPILHEWKWRRCLSVRQIGHSGQGYESHGQG